MRLSKQNPQRTHLIDAKSEQYTPWSKNRLTEQNLERKRLYDFDYLTLGLTLTIAGGIGPSHNLQRYLQP